MNLRIAKDSQENQNLELEAHLRVRLNECHGNLKYEPIQKEVKVDSFESVVS